MRDFSKARRVVVKVGSSTLTHESGLLNIRRVEQLVKVLADIENSGRQVVLVSSGAMAVGVGKLGLREKPCDMPGKQAVAAIGQCELMYIYDKHFSEYNHVTSQVLLTRDVVDDPMRKRNVQNTFERLLGLGTIPIVNENDTVCTEEIEHAATFGDNDTLSATVAELAGADLLVILSDIDGLFDGNPRENPDAKLLHEVKEITPEIEACAAGAGSARGTGGMITKIHAAQIATAAGVDMVIMNGAQPKRLYDLFENAEIGTYFPAAK
ncbi:MULTISPECIES: glutamate 5-kinase [Anaerotruncus]|uniref:Glutamate 5-kinase n=2 Tax=Anaerotruncus TaxID=244127 RepID=A0A498CY05_9FIRM|nr:MULTISPECIES: glutamate 5-kinase [Anaerotruncus]MBC3939631.1 glutamate 5-kinase [Anaerotruncus massiliensis (ex Togo et al. 2019)]MCQ4896985.1 glutamate 5-kinase [Anaerotruncus sp. DFI.9.16]RLL08670.1 glutamate 5-kinase [Anaerotruncus massiliensis (ex Liu et al. 2021)]